MRQFLIAVAGIVALGHGAAQAQGALDTPFECAGEAATYFVGYEDGDMDFVYVSTEFASPRQDEQLEFALRAAPSGSGYRFAGDFAEFVGSGDEAFLEIDGQRIDCVETQPASQSAAETEIVARAGQSLGGVLRAGPGTEHDRLDGLAEGTPLTIEGYAGVSFDGYEWFEVTVGDRSGFQWGGIMCSEGEQIPGIFSQCASNAVDAGPPGAPWWMAFAVDGNRNVGHGHASTEGQAGDFALQHCGNPDCDVVDTSQAQCHALAHQTMDGGYYYGVADGDDLQSVEFEALGRCQSALVSGSCEMAYSFCQ